MPFPYYDRLSRRDQAQYRRSDEVPALRLPPPAARGLRTDAEALRAALAADDVEAVAAAAARIAGGLSDALGAPAAPAVHVLAVRPTGDAGELHGLYTLDAGEVAVIRVWMRTARHARVVAFRTFLRTLLHEVCHHLDFTVLGLERSFHTQGFFQRESSLFRQIAPEDARIRSRRA